MEKKARSGEICPDSHNIQEQIVYITHLPNDLNSFKIFLLQLMWVDQWSKKAKGKHNATMIANALRSMTYQKTYNKETQKYEEVWESDDHVRSYVVEKKDKQGNVISQTPISNKDQYLEYNQNNYIALLPIIIHNKNEKPIIIFYDEDANAKIIKTLLDEPDASLEILQMPTLDANFKKILELYDIEKKLKLPTAVQSNTSEEKKILFLELDHQKREKKFNEELIKFSYLLKPDELQHLLDLFNNYEQKDNNLKNKEILNRPDIYAKVFPRGAQNTPFRQFLAYLISHNNQIKSDTYGQPKEDKENSDTRRKKADEQRIAILSDYPTKVVNHPDIKGHQDLSDNAKNFIDEDGNPRPAQPFIDFKKYIQSHPNVIGTIPTTKTLARNTSKAKTSRASRKEATPEEMNAITDFFFKDKLYEEEIDRLTERNKLPLEPSAPSLANKDSNIIKESNDKFAKEVSDLDEQINRLEQNIAQEATLQKEIDAFKQEAEQLQNAIQSIKSQTNQLNLEISEAQLKEKNQFEEITNKTIVEQKNAKKAQKKLQKIKESIHHLETLIETNEKTRDIINQKLANSESFKIFLLQHLNNNTNDSSITFNDAENNITLLQELIDNESLDQDVRKQLLQFKTTTENSLKQEALSKSIEAEKLALENQKIQEDINNKALNQLNQAKEKEQLAEDKADQQIKHIKNLEAKFNELKLAEEEAQKKANFLIEEEQNLSMKENTEVSKATSLLNEQKKQLEKLLKIDNFNELKMTLENNDNENPLQWTTYHHDDIKTILTNHFKESSDNKKTLEKLQDIMKLDLNMIDEFLKNLKEENAEFILEKMKKQSKIFTYENIKKIEQDVATEKNKKSTPPTLDPGISFIDKTFGTLWRGLITIISAPISIVKWLWSLVS